MPGDMAQIDVQVEAGDEVSADELDRLTLQLQHELLQVDVEAVERRYEGEAPEGSRAIEIAALGALIVKLASHPDVIRSVVDTVRSWLTRKRSGTVKLKLGDDELELTGVSSEQQQQLIDAWIERHSA